MKKNKYGIQTTWESGLIILKDPKILIPDYIKYVCDDIQEKIKDNEFSILTSGRWTKNGFEIDENYVIPIQEVGGVDVDFKEELDSYVQDGYNTIIHSHPFNSSSFSCSDNETINSNFDCSILYSQGDFTASTLRIKISEDIRIVINPNIKYISPIMDINIDNIKTKQFGYGVYWNKNMNRVKKNSEKENKVDDWHNAYLFDGEYHCLENEDEEDEEKEDLYIKINSKGL